MPPAEAADRFANGGSAVASALRRFAPQRRFAEWHHSCKPGVAAGRKPAAFLEDEAMLYVATLFALLIVVDTIHALGTPSGEL